MKEYGPFALRIGVGGIFVVSGILKLMMPQGVVAMLSHIGFPVATFWAWLLIVVELVCGAAVVVGFKLKYVTVPLAIVLLVAIVAHPGGLSGALKDAVILSGLVSLWLSGPGALGLSKK